MKFLLIFLSVHSLWGSERIIALSPAINEIIFALGAGGKIIANTDYALYPEASKNLPKVGGFFSPSLEKIVSLKPTLVVMQQNNHKLNLKLKRLGIKTKVIKINTIQDIKNNINKIGIILNKKQKAKALVEKINLALKSLKNIVNNKKILIVFGRNPKLDKNVFVAGKNLYYDEIINKSNNSNALQSNRKGQPILNMENIIACNPDIILLLARDSNDGLSHKDLIAPWLKLPISASKHKAIYINSHIYAGIPSDRISLFVRDFKMILENYRDKNVTD